VPLGETREGRAREGRGLGCGAGRGAGRSTGRGAGRSARRGAGRGGRRVWRRGGRGREGAYLAHRHLPASAAPHACPRVTREGLGAGHGGGRVGRREGREREGFHRGNAPHVALGRQVSRKFAATCRQVDVV